jgi:uncharacterized protein (DUF2141 family)
MKTTIVTIAMSMSIIMSFAQGKKYQEKMEKTLKEMSTSKSIEDYQKVANTFQLISEKEKTEWLPNYYNSFSYIIMSFKETDAEKKDEYLDLAEISIEKSIKIAPKEAENFALKSFYYTARLVVNPMKRGGKYSILSNIENQRALKFDPTNVRAKYLDISGSLGKAKFFGKNTDKYCVEANELLNVWEDYKLRSSIHPKWGKKNLQQIAGSCKNKKKEVKKEEKVIEGNTLTIKFSNLKNGGSIQLELLNEKNKSIKKIEKLVENNTCIITLKEIKNGKYAVQYYHDENNNKKMDLGAYGIPQEGYGFSNNARGIMSAPKFEKQLFEINKDITITLKTKY